MSPWPAAAFATAGNKFLLLPRPVCLINRAAMRITRLWGRLVGCLTGTNRAETAVDAGRNRQRAVALPASRLEFVFEPTSHVLLRNLQHSQVCVIFRAELKFLEKLDSTVHPNERERGIVTVIRAGLQGNEPAPLRPAIHRSRLNLKGAVAAGLGVVNGYVAVERLQGFAGVCFHCFHY